MEMKEAIAQLRELHANGDMDDAEFTAQLMELVQADNTPPPPQGEPVTPDARQAEIIDAVNAALASFGAEALAARDLTYETHRISQGRGKRTKPGATLLSMRVGDRPFTEALCAKGETALVIVLKDPA